MYAFQVIGKHSERRARRTQKAREKLAPDDPLRYQHVLRGNRLNHDEPASDDGADDIDLQAWIDDPGEFKPVDVDE